MDADPTEQNLQQVMWRGGDTLAKMKVYITTIVNFSDKPVGCITIAAARETAEGFCGEYPKAAWFLQYRPMWMMPRWEPTPWNVCRPCPELVAKQGGFEFQEILMSGDKESADGEPHKGLIWENKADRLRVNVKLNLGAKKAGLHLMDNIEPEKVLPEVITKRELWRVAQSQYEPLGLLCGFTIRFKVLMRSMAEEASGSVINWDEPIPVGTNNEFQQVVSHLADLRAITFPWD